MDLGLTGKVALITGSGEGIGYAAADRIVQEGGNVVLIGRRADLVEAAATRLNGRGPGKAIAFAGDVTDPDLPRRLVAAARDAFGRVDILVNNAGTSRRGAFEELDQATWQQDLDLKLFAAMALIRAVIPEMRRQGGGRIVNVTNIGGRAPGAGTMPTTVSRAAGIAMTKALSRELASDNILVNTVCIGLIKSGQHERRHAREGHNQDLDAFYAEDAKARAIPLGRVGEAAEAGDVIAFLVSARASYLTGIAVNIDGGSSPVP